MEEDIKIVEEWLEQNRIAFKNFFEESMVIPRKREEAYKYFKQIKALENLLTRYKQLEEENKNTMPIKLVLDMIDDLDKRRDIQKDIEPITGYWSKRAMLKKILKQAGFDYSKYKKEKEI